MDYEKLIAELESYTNQMAHCIGGDAAPANYHQQRTMATQAAAAIRELMAENKINYENAVTVSDMLVKKGVELTDLRAKLAPLGDAQTTTEQLSEQIEELKAKLKACEEALNFYADESNYNSDGAPQVWYACGGAYCDFCHQDGPDCIGGEKPEQGLTARHALAALKGGKHE